MSNIGVRNVGKLSCLLVHTVPALLKFVKGVLIVNSEFFKFILKAFFLMFTFLYISREVGDETI